MARAQVSATAYLTAFARARATADRTLEFSDPYAEYFAQRCPRWVRALTQLTSGDSVMVRRTVVMDELIVASLNQQPAPRTLINIGAGFDARPYRLALPPDTKVIEIDQAEVFEVKEELLPATNSPVPLTRLVKDIEDHSWARELRLVVRQRLSTVVTEGLLAYFPDRFLPVFAQQLARLPVATWMADVVSLGTAERLNAVRAGEGAERLCFHGMGSLEPLRQADWVCTEIRPLVAHDGSLWGPAHHEGGVTSTIPDCVAVFRRLPV